MGRRKKAVESEVTGVTEDVTKVMKSKVKEPEIGSYEWAMWKLDGKNMLSRKQWSHVGLKLYKDDKGLWLKNPKSKFEGAYTFSNGDVEAKDWYIVNK